jgi:hypothetical protein
MIEVNTEEDLAMKINPADLNRHDSRELFMRYRGPPTDRF